MHIIFAFWYMYTFLWSHLSESGITEPGSEYVNRFSRYCESVFYSSYTNLYFIQQYRNLLYFLGIT